MTTFVLSPASTWDPASPYRTPRVMLEQGLLQAHRQRANGTLRHVPLAPVGSTLRDTAEWVQQEVDEGASVQAVARQLHTSLATVRRYLLSLDITEQVEGDEWDDLVFDAAGEPQWLGAGPGVEIEEMVDEPACTCAADALGNNWHTPGCPLADTTTDAQPTPETACDPEATTGTTAEDLADALAASLATASA